jgi:quercetin dioxygenase-like cupin family protein
MKDQGWIIGPGEGRTAVLYGVHFTYKADAAATGGGLALIETEIPRGTLVKPHRHEREDEYSLVLAGRLGARLGDEESVLEPGSWLIKPRGVPHAIWNAGDEPARMLEIIVPGGFERYFSEVEPILQQHGPEITKRFYELAEQYGVTVLDEWVEDLETRHGVKLNPARD